MHPFLLPATLLLGLPAVLASNVNVAITAKSMNPILNILTNITDTSRSLSEQTSGPMDFNLDRQYKARGPLSYILQKVPCSHAPRLMRRHVPFRSYLFHTNPFTTHILTCSFVL